MKYTPEYKAQAMFDAALDESHDDIIICGLSYLPSEALKSVDPIAYRAMFLDWLDAEHFTIEE